MSETNLTDKQWLALMRLVPDDSVRAILTYPPHEGDDLKILHAGDRKTYRVSADGTVREG